MTKSEKSKRGFLSRQILLPSFSLSFCFSFFCLFVFLSFCLYCIFCLSVFLPLCLSVFLPFYLLVFQSFCLFVFLSFCLALCHSIFCFTSDKNTRGKIFKVFFPKEQARFLRKNLNRSVKNFKTRGSFIYLLFTYKVLTKNIRRK